jgi:hypothetical protein
MGGVDIIEKYQWVFCIILGIVPGAARIMLSLEAYLM